MNSAPEAVTHLSRDLAKASGELGDDAARFLVDTYYSLQADRMRADSQVRALTESGEPAAMLHWLAENSRVMENQVKLALSHYAKGREAGRWALKQLGIGPVLAAGLLAHIDFQKAPTAGALWRFAGLDPTQNWQKGSRRPWNARLKSLCWKIGESFVRLSHRDDCFYGRMYRKRKELEVQRNEAGDLADQAAAALERHNFGRDTAAYAHYIKGQLPPGHLDARAKRYTVKIFLSHFHEIGWRYELGKEPPVPFALGQMSHAHKIEPPH
jgi:hypothetical protein